MAKSTKRIEIILDVDDKGTKKLVKFTDTAQSGFRKAASAVSPLTGAFTKLTRLAGGLFSKLTSLKTVLVGYGAFRIADSFIDTAAAAEKAEVLLGRLYGTARQGKAAFDWVLRQDFTKVFGVEAIQNAVVRLKAAGFEPMEGMIETLANSLSAFGKTAPEEMKLVILALEQMAGKGVVSMEELRRQLGERIPTAMRLMAKGLGMSMAEMVKLIEKGGLEANRGINAMLSEMKKAYSGATTSIMNTWGGMTRQLSTWWEIFKLRTMRSGLFDWMKEQLKGVLDWIDRMEREGNLTRWAKQLGEGVKAGMVTVKEWLDKAKKWWDQHGEDVKTVLGAIVTAIGWVIDKLATAINHIKNAHEYAKKAQVEGAQYANVVGTPIYSSATGEVNPLEARTQAIIQGGHATGQIASDLAGSASMFGTYLDDLYHVVGETAKKVVDSGNKVSAAALKSLESYYQKAKEIVETAGMEELERRIWVEDKKLAEIKKSLGDTSKLDAATKEKLQTAEEALDITIARLKDKALDKDLARIRKLQKSYADEKQKRLALEQDYAMEVARLSGDTRKVQELELEAYTQAWIKRGLDRTKAEELAQLKLRDTNKSTTQKWIEAWSNTGERVKDIMKSTFESLTKSMGDFFGDLLFEIRSLDDALKSLESLGKSIAKNLLGSLATTYLQGSIADVLKGFGLGGTSMGSTSTGAAGTAADLAGKASTAYKVGAKIANLLGIGAGAEYAGLEGSSAIFDYAAFGAEGAQTGLNTGLMAGGLMGPTALMGYAAAPIVVGAAITPLMSSLLGRSAMTPDEARDKIAADFAFLDEQIAMLYGNAERMGEMFGGFLTPAVRDAASEIDQIGDLAGYSAEQIGQMTDALGEQCAAVITAASLSQSLNYQLEDLVNNFQRNIDEGQLWQGGLHEMTTLLGNMVDSLGLGSDATEELRKSAFGLAEELYMGNMSVEQITTSLQERFNLALEDAISRGQATAETMRGVAEAIKAIPTSWHTEYMVTRSGGLNTMEIAHLGGLVMHQGGTVSGMAGLAMRSGWITAHGGAWLNLKPREVPVIAEEGEVVTQRRSVNRETLPELRYINRYGRVPPAQQAPAQAQAVEQPINITIPISTWTGQEIRTMLLEYKARPGWWVDTDKIELGF